MNLSLAYKNRKPNDGDSLENMQEEVRLMLQLLAGSGSFPDLRMMILLTKEYGPLDENLTVIIIITLNGLPICSRWIFIQQPILLGQKHPHP
ncbi:hypothetical protein D8674_002702 [Pyrus ussuriensis x Pyrus communis]|uniref:Uncharacterized protein n=1 Tax=Pyrus ussuriensis x Pyrus communis TaxID=2448454 RepID=A0A5N5FFH0_9ROSA|nr:hypothetical protein D8674_002702 [Pyrus ussuriensis x Pyrus communis]